MQQSSLLEKLVNEIPLCISVIDQSERIVHLNQVALDFAGIKDRSPRSLLVYTIKIILIYYLIIIIIIKIY